MFNLSNYRLFRSLLFKNGLASHISAQCSRSLSSVQNEDKASDLPIPMEDPYKQVQKGCRLCQVAVDYKNIQLLSQFISPHSGRIYGRHLTGLCGRKHKEVTKAIKRARAMGFMSVTLKDPLFIKDPNICDIRHVE